MGLFSKSHTPPQDKAVGNGEIYVFLRSPDLRSASNPSWSIAVLQKAQSLSISTSKASQRPQLGQKKSFLSFKTKQSSKPVINNNFPPLPTSPIVAVPVPAVNEVHEYTLLSGNLSITQQQSSDQISHAFDPDDESILLQILLPSYTSANNQPQSPTHRSTNPEQALPLRIEQALQRLTSMTSDLRDTETDHWLKLALVALQNEKFIAPATSGLNIERLMDFARNSLTGFEGEILQRGETSDNTNSSIGVPGLSARHIKVVDYASHVKENERLRAMFGHGYDLAHGQGNEESSEGYGKKSGHAANGDDVAHVHGGFGGGWWVSRPNDNRHHGGGGSGYRERDRDPYGGLM